MGGNERKEGEGGRGGGGEEEKREREKGEERKEMFGEKRVLVTLAVAMFPTTSTQGEALLVCNC